MLLRQRVPSDEKVWELSFLWVWTPQFLSLCYVRSFSLGILALEPQEAPTSADKAWSSLHSFTQEQLKDNLKMSTQIYTRPTTECWALHFSGARTLSKCYSIRWMYAAKLRHISPSGMQGPCKRESVNPSQTLRKQSPALQYRHHNRKRLIKIHFSGWCFSHQHFISPGSWPAIGLLSLSRGQKQITQAFQEAKCTVNKFS